MREEWGDQGATTAPESPPPPQEELSELQKDLRARRSEQGIDPEGDQVPERRPIASQQAPDNESATHKRAVEEGVLEGAPAHEEEHYDRASSDEQRRSAEESSRSVPLRVGARVRVLSGLREGAMGHIERVEYDGTEATALAQSGTPEAMFAPVKEFVVRTRDGRADILRLDPEDVELVPDAEWGRGTI